MKIDSLNIMVVGGGMYVSGRGTKSNGTIIPALLQGRKNKLVRKIGIVTTNSKTSLFAANKLKSLAKKMNINNSCDFYPKLKDDNNSYLSFAKEFKPDAVIICVPDQLHFKISTELMSLGFHCLIVKPMATNISEAKKMYKLANQKKIVAQVEFHKRFDVANLILKDAIKNEKIGTPLNALVEYSQKKIIPEKIFKSWSKNTNVFQYLGVHYVDLIYFITGFKPLNVIAWGQKKYLKSKGIDTYDSIQVIVNWIRQDGGNFISTHLTNWIDSNKSSAMSDQKISILGTNGKLISDQKNRGMQIVSDIEGVNDVNPYFTNSHLNQNTIEYSGYGIDSVLSFVKDIIDYKSKNVTLKELDFNRPSFKNSLCSVSVIEAVNKSLKKNSIITRVNL